MNAKVSLFNMLVWLPCGRHYLQKEQKKAQEDFKQRQKAKRKNQVYKLPDKAWKEETILNRMTTGSDAAKQYYTNGGRISGAVYMAQDSHWDFISQVMRLNIESNPLHMVQFSNISQLEAEVIRITLDLFHGPEDSCGLTTSGGTESILLAMLAYRQWGRERGITNPNVVASITAHAAFDKACFYFGIELRKVKVTKEMQADVAGMRAQVDSNTVCIVGSAPEYAFGYFDPLP